MIDHPPLSALPVRYHLSVPADDITLKRWSTSDKSAGDALVTTHYRELFNWLRSQLHGDKDLAADLIQQTVEVAVRKNEGIVEDFRAYLYGIAGFKLKAHFRRQRPTGCHTPSSAGRSTRRFDTLVISLRRRIDDESDDAEGPPVDVASRSPDRHLRVTLRDTRALTTFFFAPSEVRLPRPRRIPLPSRSRAPSCSHPRTHAPSPPATMPYPLALEQVARPVGQVHPSPTAASFCTTSSCR